MKPSLTIIMPAYMEAANIEAAVESTLRALASAGITDYEIIITTGNRRDGTNDGTPAIADRIASQNSRIRHIHSEVYTGLGFKYRQGVAEARKDYVMMVPGDNETAERSTAHILSHAGKADMVIPYTANKEVRAWKRRFASRGFTTLCNLLFGLRLKYYNGLCIHRRRYLRAVPMSCDSFAYMAEILVYLAKSGVSYIEVPMEVKPITNVSAAFKLRSVFEALATLASLFWRIHFRRERVKVQ